MYRIVFMGTPDFAVPTLAALLATQHVVGVVTQPDRPAGRGQQLRPSPVKLAAQAADLPVYQPASLRRPHQAAPIADWRPDVIVVAAFGQILRPHLLDLPPYGCINVHASLLPRWRGAAPIQHALLAGDASSGVCLMQMEAGLDTGPVYACLATALATDETAQTLHDRLAALGGQLIRETLPAVLAGALPAVAQDDALATYAPMIDKRDGALDWTQPAAALDRRVRAMTPWPGAYTHWQGQLLKITQAAALDGTFDGAPGQVLATGDGQIVVACGGGALRLGSVQLAGKRALTAAEFLRGRPEFVGSRLVTEGV